MKYFAYLLKDGSRHLKPFSESAYVEADSDEIYIEYLVIPFDAESRVEAEEIARAEIDQFLKALNLIVEEWPEIDRLIAAFNVFIGDSLLNPETP